MGFAALRSFKTAEEAKAYKQAIIDFEIFGEGQIYIFKESENEYEVNID